MVVIFVLSSLMGESDYIFNTFKYVNLFYLEVIIDIIHLLYISVMSVMVLKDYFSVPYFYISVQYICTYVLFFV